MKIGVRAHDFGKVDELELKQLLKDYGFDGIQLVTNKLFGKAIDEVDQELIKDNYNNQIFLLGAYFNMIHPDDNVIKDGITNFKKHLAVAQKLGAQFVGTETGSLMGSPWGYMKENHSEQSFNKVLSITKDLVDYANKHHSKVAIEGAWPHTIYSPERLKELVDRVNDKNLKVIIDVYNFLNIENHQQHLDILKTSIKLLKKDIVIFHLKDYIINQNELKQVALGDGLMQYKEMIEIIKKELPNSYLIFEGVKKEDMQKSLSFIKNLLKE